MSGTGRIRIEPRTVCGQILWQTGCPSGGPSLKESFVSRVPWRIFLRTFRANSPQWAFFSFLLLLFPGNKRLLRLSRSELFEVVEPFFSSRLHPNTSLREYVCLSRQSFRIPAEPDTEYSAATVSPTLRRLNQIVARQQGRVHGPRASPCAIGSSPSDASPPPALSSTRDDA